MNTVERHVPNLMPQQIILLNLNIKLELHLPVVWLIAQTLRFVWSCRLDKKPCNIKLTRSTLEANIMIMRKTRYTEVANIIET